jgi:MFS superfamily sulfate permease-like transporter
MSQPAAKPPVEANESPRVAVAADGAPRLRFDRNELAGSFGDIGTDLPLIIGILLATGADSASVFIVFGLMQILTGVVYGLPMPMQPLKAMAVLVITQKLSAGVLYGAGLAIGVIMLALSLSGALGWIAARIPRCVVRGIQFGLGLSLCSLALKTYLPADGMDGYALAAVGFVIVLLLRQSRRFPAALFVIALGVVYALWFKVDAGHVAAGIGLALPKVNLPDWNHILTGLVVLALPQLPLSLSNSVIATHQTVRDLFPERAVSVRRIGVTYGLVNVLNAFLGGIPTCHGCGGLAGHYAFGARTGGSVVIYGTLYVVIGLFFSGVSAEVVKVFPQPVLAVILVFEGLTLLLFIRDVAASHRDLFIALLVALCAAFLPQGYLIGMLLGLVLVYGGGGRKPEMQT